MNVNVLELTREKGNECECKELAQENENEDGCVCIENATKIGDKCECVEGYEAKENVCVEKSGCVGLMKTFFFIFIIAFIIF